MLMYVTALALVAYSASTVGALPCPDSSWQLYKDVTCIKVFTDILPFAKAKEACLTHGANLVTIKDQDMNQFVSKLISNKDRFWIGIFADEQGQFKYANGNADMSFQNWRKGEPRLSQRANDKNCVEIIGNKRGRWKIKPCHRARPYICQADAESAKVPLAKWDDLKVTWGNPRAPNAAEFFNSMPRTVSQALDQGFQKVSDCDLKAKWRGSRYVLNDDYALVLLYDVQGYIAGIQTRIPPQDTGYPFGPLQPPFVKDGDNFILTAYFVDPEIICTTGRTSADFEGQGTGTSLFIQSGDNAESDSISIPLVESGMATTQWTKGRCMPTMGQHYWYNTSEDMNCENFYPVFVLYNKGQLNAFGWSLAAELTSKRFEHPPKKVLPMFFNPVPKCLYGYEHFATMHIYLTSNVFANKC